MRSLWRLGEKAKSLWERSENHYYPFVLAISALLPLYTQQFLCILLLKYTSTSAKGSKLEALGCCSWLQVFADLGNEKCQVYNLCNNYFKLRLSNSAVIQN